MSRPSWSALRQIHDHFAYEACELFNRELSVHPQLFLVRFLEDGRPDVLELPEEMSAGFFSSAQSKDLLGHFLTDMLTEGSKLRQGFKAHNGFAPDVVVQVCEAWSRAAPTSEPVDMNASIAGHPEAIEVVLVILHTANGSYPTSHRVHDQPTRRCVFSPMAEHEPGTASSTGRMAVRQPLH